MQGVTRTNVKTLGGGESKLKKVHTKVMKKCPESRCNEMTKDGMSEDKFVKNIKNAIQSK